MPTDTSIFQKLGLKRFVVEAKSMGTENYRGIPQTRRTIVWADSKESAESFARLALPQGTELVVQYADS